MADLYWHNTCQRVCIHMFACKHDEIIGCVKADVWSICQFDSILIYIWFKQRVPKYSSDKVTQVIEGKVSGGAAYVSVKFNQNAKKGIS